MDGLRMGWSIEQLYAAKKKASRTNNCNGKVPLHRSLTDRQNLRGIELRKQLLLERAHLSWVIPGREGSRVNTRPIRSVLTSYQGQKKHLDIRFNIFKFALFSLHKELLLPTRGAFLMPFPMEPSAASSVYCLSVCLDDKILFHNVSDKILFHHGWQLFSGALTCQRGCRQSRLFSSKVPHEQF